MINIKSKMKKHVVFTSSALLIMILIFTASTFTADPKEISRKASDAIHFDAIEMTSTLKIIDNKGNTRTRQLRNVTRKFGTTTKTKIRFMSPNDVAGTTLLIHDHENKMEDMWIFMPSLRNTRRIVSNEKGKSFMGSEFSNADMTRPNLNDFNFRLLGTETVDNRPCYKIESTFINRTAERDNGYKKRISFIDTENYLTYRTDFYGSDDKRFKSMYLSDYRKQSNGKYFSYKMSIENFKNKRKSEIEVVSFKPSTGSGEKYFDVGNIEAE